MPLFEGCSHHTTQNRSSQACYRKKECYRKVHVQHPHHTHVGLLYNIATLHPNPKLQQQQHHHQLFTILATSHTCVPCCPCKTARGGDGCTSARLEPGLRTLTRQCDTSRCAHSLVCCLLTLHSPLTATLSMEPHPLQRWPVLFMSDTTRCTSPLPYLALGSRLAGNTSLSPASPWVCRYLFMRRVVE